jgi:hypothetical protein
MLSPLPSPQTISCGALHFVIPPVPARRGTEPRSSYCAAPSMATDAAFLEESRMNLVSSTEPYRKSGGSGGICASSRSRRRHYLQFFRAGTEVGRLSP